MDSPQTPFENGDEKPAEIARNGYDSGEKPPRTDSGGALRKRRNLPRRRSSSLSRRRELTPVRDLAGVERSSDDEEENDARERRPKTPERRRRRIRKTTSDITEKVLENVRVEDEDKNEKNEVGQEKKEVKEDVMEVIQDGAVEMIGKEIGDFPQHPKGDVGEETTPIPQVPEGTIQRLNLPEESTGTKLENLVNLSQTEFISMLDKAKRKIKSSKDRYHKLKSNQKRSQSVPRVLTDEELLESFKRAQQQSAERELVRNRTSSGRKYSTDSAKSTSSAENRVLTPIKPIRRQITKPQPLVKRKPLIKQLSSNKIIEILDPKTSRVIKTKQIINIRMEWRDVVTVYKYVKLKEILAEYKKFKADMTEEYRKIVALRRRCLFELVLMMVVCGLGGVVFKFVEGTFENFYKCGVKRVKRDFVDLLWVKSHNLREEDWKSLARNRLRAFEEELHTAHEAGIHTYTGQRSWSFLNGVVYSLTIVTTIGYGHLYPTTTLGKGLTILYALIGIPLFLIILTDFGKLFTRCIKYVWAFFRRLCYTGRCRRVRKTTHVKEIFKGAQIVYDIAHLRRPSAFESNIKVTDPEASTGTPGTPAPSNFEIDDQFNLPITLALSLLVLYIFLGAVAFNWLEGWSFFTSFYFVFISMSTIGFGDFVPEHHTFMIFTIVYLVFGLALMSMCINVVQDKLSDTFKQASAKLGATFGVSVNDEDGSIATVPPLTVEMPEIHVPETASLKVPPNAV